MVRGFHLAAAFSLFLLVSVLSAGVAESARLSSVNFPSYLSCEPSSITDKGSLESFLGKEFGDKIDKNYTSEDSWSNFLSTVISRLVGKNKYVESSGSNPATFCYTWEPGNGKVIRFIKNKDAPGVLREKLVWVDTGSTCSGYPSTLGSATNVRDFAVKYFGAPWVNTVVDYSTLENRKRELRNTIVCYYDEYDLDPDPPGGNINDWRLDKVYRLPSGPRYDFFLGFADGSYNSVDSRIQWSEVDGGGGGGGGGENIPPVADAGPDQALGFGGQAVNVVFSGAGSFDPDGYIVSYAWNFGDGGTGTGSVASHAYAHEGAYTVTLTVTDHEGASDSDTMTVTLTELPAVSDDYANDSAWVATDQTVTITAQDSSGISSVKYCTGSACSPSGGQAVSGPPYRIAFTQNINSAVRYQAWDTKNNPSAVGQFTIMIDKTKPATTDNSDSDLHGENVVIRLACSDGGSGCDKTYYCVSGNGSTTCTPGTVSGLPSTNVVVSCDAFSYCEKVIRYYSKDKVGNTESARTSKVVRIDTRIPTCGMGALNQYVTSGSIGLSWSGMDSQGSEGGVTGYRVWYSKDSGPWTVWNTFASTVKSGTFAAESEHSYGFRCQSQSELSGWGSYSTSVSTFVDATPPSASMASLPEWTTQEPFTVSWSGEDPGSGIDSYDVQYSTSVGWVNWLTDTPLASGEFGAGSPASLQTGTYRFRARAANRAGLQGNWSSEVSTGVDLDPPVCSIAGLPAYVTDPDYSISWSGQDQGSGIEDYDVDYSTDGNGWTPLIYGTTDTSRDPNIMDGRYYFRCRARDAAGNLGEWSGAESTMIDTRAPLVGMHYSGSVMAGSQVNITANLYDASSIKAVSLIHDGDAINETNTTVNGPGNWTVYWSFTAPGDYGSDGFMVVTEDLNGNSERFTYSFDVVLCDDGGVRECGTDEGECRKGNQTCVDGQWGDCLGGMREKLETCDGRDNDCDGETDEGIDCACVPGDTRECGTDEGECRKGTQACLSSEEWGPCVGDYLGPSPEVCDGRDNDCDGRVDYGAMCCEEGRTRPCGYSNVGVCRFGESVCRNGLWSECARDVEPSGEACGNGIDDDCDGETDEGCGLCTNGIQDSEEEGIDCGGPCPQCGEFPWIMLSVAGVIIIAVVGLFWWRARSKGEELSWDSLKRKWSA
jgi:hypothetical protein